MPRLYLFKKDRRRNNALAYLCEDDISEIMNWIKDNCPKAKLAKNNQSIYFHRRPDMHLFKIFFEVEYSIDEHDHAGRRYWYDYDRV